MFTLTTETSCDSGMGVEEVDDARNVVKKVMGVVGESEVISALD